MAAVLAGCSGEGDDASSPALLDETPARKLPVGLDGIEAPEVLTSVTVVPVDSIEPESPAGVCLQTWSADSEATGSAAVRFGVSSESVTFREAGGAAVFGCSNTPGPREGNRRWCGGAYGQLYSGRLRDPRLDIICQTSEGTQVGFAGIEPGEGTRYVAVAQPEYTEVYEPAGELPVRIFTLSGVDIDSSSATFSVSEHDAEGKRLREYELKAAVAG